MLKTIKKVRAPVRIDFAGGTTDIPPFAYKYRGYVLNAAINKYVYGTFIVGPNHTKLEYHTDLPTLSGLGTSSAMNVVWIALITKDMSKEKIAESVFNVEHAIKECSINGRQDQYASAFGGINFMEFAKEKVYIHPLNLRKSFIKKLNDKLILVYSGIAHYSGSSNKAMMDNFLKGKNTAHLLRIKSIAEEMKNALLKEDLDKFADLMNKETDERRELSKIIVSPRLQKIINDGMKNGATAAKVCGSGGGGSILFFGDKNKIIKKFGNSAIDFKFDFEGLSYIK